MCWGLFLHLWSLCVLASFLCRSGRCCSALPSIIAACSSLFPFAWSAVTYYAFSFLLSSFFSSFIFSFVFLGALFSWSLGAEVRANFVLLILHPSSCFFRTSTLHLHSSATWSPFQAMGNIWTSTAWKSFLNKKFGDKWKRLLCRVYHCRVCQPV